jgi:glycosyltransferase involved in cell wall biosynthesis
LIRELSNRSRIAPIIFITDATPNFLETFYGWPISTKHFETEKIALESAAHIIYSSDYMAELAKQDYQQEISNIDSKISVIPFGLNMDLIPDSLPEKSVTGPIKLVFIAREWERKGGQIALDTAIALNEKGTATHLTIIGCTPPDSVVDKPYITLVPFLNKNIPEDLEKYSSILSKAHFLILPTRADCTPMVIAECNSYGVPAVTTNVGGIPTLVTDGSNGILLELDDDFRVYEQKISDLFHDSDRFAKLSESSREVILNRLNWKIWAENVLKVTSKY